MRRPSRCKFLFLVLMPLGLLAQRVPFAEEDHPAPPDYTLESSWAALPFVEDAADVVPIGETWISDSLKQVDVFYVHPTIYRKGKYWNATLHDRRLNRKVDNYPVRLQASVFNAACRVYAPRYRQAVVSVFYRPSDEGFQALDLAYQDVKHAFVHFLEHYSKGRPFIIAGHSQGTYHARRLLREMIDTTELRNRLVAAYVVGFAMNDTMYQNLDMCSDSTGTGCYLSWMSYRDGYEPKGWWFEGTQSINPLTWTTDTGAVHVQAYNGTVVLNPARRFSRPITTRLHQCGGQVLWVRTKAPLFRWMNVLHVADYGLFYHSIRENVAQRVAHFTDTDK